jgi:hypothetical protein
MTVPTNYILIDFENVQPSNLQALAEHPFNVIVFVGANQTKVSFDLAASMQHLGKSAQYIKISGNGPNALDFHIAYYIGEIAAGDPKAHFYIISKDTGFDPLIKHLKTKRIHVQREKVLSDIPLLKVTNATSTDDKIAAIVKNLKGRGNARPRKVSTLSNTVKNLFAQKLKDSEVTQLVNQLIQLNYITVKDNHVTYQLPKKI